MILTQTPYRMSFFGGGTDFPEYFEKNGGQVLSTSIDKYCYISCRRLPPFFEHKHRIVYSVIEDVSNVEDIKHPAVRAILSEFDDGQGFEIHHDGDLPARAGLGSSSAFAVGLIHALRAFNGKISSKRLLADEAIRFEQNVMNEVVGSQDQIAASYGGFNNIVFHKNKSYSVRPVIAKSDIVSQLNQNLMLFFTGITRFASEISKEQLQNVNKNVNTLEVMSEQVDEAMKILSSSVDAIDDFGILLDDAWKLKQSLSDKVSSQYINDLYQIAKSKGAIGGKILGAGGGGFILFYARPEFHDQIKNALSTLIHVPFQFENFGSRISVYQPEK